MYVIYTVVIAWAMCVIKICYGILNINKSINWIQTCVLTWEHLQHLDCQLRVQGIFDQSHLDPLHLHLNPILACQALLLHPHQVLLQQQTLSYAVMFWSSLGLTLKWKYIFLSFTHNAFFKYCSNNLYNNTLDLPFICRCLIIRIRVGDCNILWGRFRKIW